MPAMAAQKAQSAKDVKRQRLSALLVEAAKSRTDAVTGERRCLGCGKAFASVERLAQHLQDAHGSRNSPTGGTPSLGSRASQLTFGDVLVTRDMRSSSRRPAPQATAPAPQHFPVGAPWRPQSRPSQQSSLQHHALQPPLSQVLAESTRSQQPRVAGAAQQAPNQQLSYMAPLPPAAPASSATLAQRPTTFLAALKQDSHEQRASASPAPPLQQRKEERLGGAASTTRLSSTALTPVHVPTATPGTTPMLPPNTRLAPQQGGLARVQARPAQEAGTKAAGAAARTTAQVAAPPAPPPGTRLKSRRKRTTRLKRAFRRGEAVRAAQSWLEVLSEVEEALQATRELLGATANELEAAGKAGGQGEPSTDGGAGPGTVGTINSIAGPAGLAEHTSKVQVLQMVLLEARKQEEQLQRAHLLGRAHLEKAQAKLLSVEPGNGNSVSSNGSNLQQLLQQEAAPSRHGPGGVPVASGDTHGSPVPGNCSSTAACAAARTPQLSAQPGSQPATAGLAAPDAACLAAPHSLLPGTVQPVESQAAAGAAAGAAKAAPLATGQEGVAAGEAAPGLAADASRQRTKGSQQVDVKQLHPGSPETAPGSDPGSSESSVSGLNWGDTLAAWLPPPQPQHAPWQHPRQAEQQQGGVSMQQQQCHQEVPQLPARLTPPPPTLHTLSPEQGGAQLLAAEVEAVRRAGAASPAAAAGAGVGSEGHGAHAASSAAPAPGLPAGASKDVAPAPRQPAHARTAPPPPSEPSPTGLSRESPCVIESSSGGGGDSGSSGSVGLQWGDTLASWKPQHLAREPAAPASQQRQQAAASPALVQALPPSKPERSEEARLPDLTAPEASKRSALARMTRPSGAGPLRPGPIPSQQPALAAATSQQSAAAEVTASAPSAGAQSRAMSCDMGGGLACSDSRSGSGSSTASESSGGSGLSMAWGDTLQAWAAHLKTQARGLLQGLAVTGVHCNMRQGKQGQQAMRQHTAAGQRQQQQQGPLPGVTASDQREESQAGKVRVAASAPAGPAPPAKPTRAAAPTAAPAAAVANTAAAAADVAAVKEPARNHCEGEEGKAPTEATPSSSPPCGASQAALAPLHSWLNSLDHASLDFFHQQDLVEEGVQTPGPGPGCASGGGPSSTMHGQGVGADCGMASTAVGPGDSLEGKQEKQGMVPEQPQHGMQSKGAFSCALCQVQVSGEFNYQQHLGSKRHAKRLAQQAQHTVAEHSVTQQAVRAVHLAAQQAQQQPRTYVGTEAASVAPYVDQVITAELNEVVLQLLGQLLVWQERVRLQDPANLKRKRRLLSGMREVTKALKTKRAKAVLVAPNINAVEGEGEEEYPITALLQLARDREIPVVFALSRQRMGKVLGPSSRKRVSAFAILDYDGTNELFKRMLALAQDGRQAWAKSHAARPPALERAVP